MGRKGLWAVVAAVLVLVSAAWVWSAGEAQAPATPPAAGAQEQPKAEAAPAPAAEAAPAVGAPTAPAGEEAAAEKVKGWIITVKWGEGAPTMRDLTIKVAGDKMAVEGMEWAKIVYMVDAGAKATYAVTTRHTPGSAMEESSTFSSVEKFPWGSMDRLRNAGIDDAIMVQHMRSRNLTPEERDAAEALAKQLQVLKQPATVEATEETQKFGDYDCVKYTLTQGEKLNGIAWVAKGVKIDAPFWAMVGHLLQRGAGGLPALAQLDGLEAGFPIRVNLDYTIYDKGRLVDQKLNFWIDKITEAEFDPAELVIPKGAQITEPMRGI
jgi:hypothetical protein